MYTNLNVIHFYRLKILLEKLSHTRTLIEIKDQKARNESTILLLKLQNVKREM